MVVTHSYVSQATHVFLGLLPLCCILWVGFSTKMAAQASDWLNGVSVSQTHLVLMNCRSLIHFYYENHFEKSKTHLTCSIYRIYTFYFYPDSVYLEEVRISKVSVLLVLYLSPTSVKTVSISNIYTMYYCTFSLFMSPWLNTTGVSLSVCLSVCHTLLLLAPHAFRRRNTVSVTLAKWLIGVMLPCVCLPFHLSNNHSFGSHTLLSKLLQVICVP